MSILLIVESPAKCQKIKKFLNEEFPNLNFEVIPSGGHIEEIKNPGVNIDISNNFQPYYIFKNNNFVKNIIKCSKKAKEVYIATDLDYSGSFIGSSICKLLNLDIKKTKRLIFNSITKSAIINSFKNPELLNINHIEYEKSRQIIDRLIGFKLSPLAYKTLKCKNNSIGRCQTVALELIIDKDKERNEMINNTLKDYYKLSASLYLLNDLIIANNKITSKDIQTFNNEKLHFIIKEITTNKKIIEPPKPFITSTLQREISNKLGYPVISIMKILQKLYEKGLITYIRTDCPIISKEFKEIIQKYIDEKYSKDYVNYEIKDETKSNSQNGHEAIRVTNLNFSSIDLKDLSNQELNVFKIIRKNTIQSQMKENIIYLTKIVFSNNLNNIEISSSIQSLIFKGFKILDQEEKYFDIEKIKDLKENQIVDFKNINFDYSLESVPSQFNEQKLIKTLEKLGIGRPSTFAYIVDIIQKRNYVNKTDIEGKKMEISNYRIAKLDNFCFEHIKTEKVFFNEYNKLVPTEKGKRLIEFMKNNFNYIIDYNYTSKIENELDKIANEEIKSLDVLNNFWDSLNLSLMNYRKKIKGENKINNSNKDLGIYKNQKIILKNSIYGYYVIFNGKNKSIKIDKSFNDITLKDIEEYLQEDNNNLIGEFQGKSIELFKGPFGYYFVYDGKNYKSNGIEEIIDKDEKLKKCIEIINQNIKTLQDINLKKEYRILKSLKKENCFYINIYKIEKTKNKYLKTIFIKNKFLQEDLKNNIQNINLDLINKIEKESIFKKK